ncbi:hypothetical protein KIH39_19815 [Telmatocola sphagniphila]|jgi:hypothetical protein|uniref:Uncharacterized protein n=1 Tax=Telmatocola sphagniphila TaxID=1123043 RepID=A0A8E6EU87_9BACT|nr:hypothetical protein [Telmatocola sphagniphila]QVL31075.1 hypothetical protein KIH39_19815 [Telmatocola sphagniphila]
MPEKLDDLWGDSIPQREVLDPINILTKQIGPLETRSKGELTAQITVTDAENTKTIQFDIVAKKLGGRRVTLLQASSKKADIYPLKIISDGLQADLIPENSIQYIHGIRKFNASITEEPKEIKIKTPLDGVAIAHDDTNFAELIGIILRSNYTRSAIQSLLASIANLGKEKNPAVVYI